MTQNKTLKSGAIVLSSVNTNNIALIYRSRQSDWSFPKGHVDGGETVEQTIVREMKEETNLDVEVLKSLPDLEYSNENSGEPIIMKMFLVKSKDDYEYKSEFEGDKIDWVDIDNVVNKLTYTNLKNYYNSILPTVKEFLNIN